MFKGTNQIELNEATMILAIQHYFNCVIFAEGKSPNVVSVKPSSKGYGNQGFTIEVKEPEE